MLFSYDDQGQGLVPLSSFCQCLQTLRVGLVILKTHRPRQEVVELLQNICPESGLDCAARTGSEEGSLASRLATGLVGFLTSIFSQVLSSPTS